MFFNTPVIITAWKLVGYLGVAMFSGRWLVQMHYSRKAGRSVLPLGYWLMSICGSLLLLSYYIFGKNDSVGILSNLFPSFVASYNLFLELTHRRQAPKEAAKDLQDAAPHSDPVMSSTEDDGSNS